ncbi:MAG: sugar phosphate isomerase/epimerase [Lachnospiraceae bacterium]|jgi:D-psicose/D-tagatose/L-ribulose 3-epimerase|nr:sugar phosphate isomerase/epimerase [Lachnospiraceae bacterium]
MKYGIYFAYWEKEWFADYKKYIDKVADLGFDILEISCGAFRNTYTTDEQLYELRDYAKEKNVILTAGYGPQASQNLGSADPAVQENALLFFTETLHKLKKMDIKALGGGLYSYWPVDYSKPVDKEGDFERSVANMKKVAKVAEECDIVLGMEVLNRFEGYLLNTCDEAIRYVDAVGSKNVRIMLDTFHMSIEEDNIAAAIRKAGDKLCHLHLGERNRKVPGKGTMPWDEIGQALRDINYQHAAVMEPFVMPGGTIGSEVKVWRNLVEDTSEAALDADAKGALQFVKHVFGL